MTRWELSATDWIDEDGPGHAYTGRRPAPIGINERRWTWTGKNELPDTYRAKSPRPLTGMRDERAGLIVRNIRNTNTRRSSA